MCLWFFPHWQYCLSSLFLKPQDLELGDLAAAQLPNPTTGGHVPGTGCWQWHHMAACRSLLGWEVPQHPCVQPASNLCHPRSFWATILAPGRKTRSFNNLQHFPVYDICTQRDLYPHERPQAVTISSYSHDQAFAGSQPQGLPRVQQSWATDKKTLTAYIWGWNTTFWNKVRIKWYQSRWHRFQISANKILSTARTPSRDLHVASLTAEAIEKYIN